MSNLTDYSSLDGSQWGHALQESSLRADAIEAKAGLQGRKVAFITKLGNQDKIYSIQEIFQITMQVLDKPTSMQAGGLQEMQRGLLHIQESLKGSEELAMLQGRMSEVDAGILKHLLAKEGNLAAEDRALIKAIAEKNPKLLLENTSLLEGLLAKCSQKESLPLFETLILQAGKLDDKLFTNLQELLFRRSGKESSPFMLLMAQTNGNLLCDRLLPKMDNEQLNVKTDWRDQLLDFVFSPKRYQALFLQEGDISESLAGKIKELSIRASGFGSGDVQRSYDASMAASKTLTQTSTVLIKARENWQSALDFMRRRAKGHRETPPGKDMDYLQMMAVIHKKLTDGDPEVKHAGITRNQIGHINRAGGSWRHLYCQPSSLRANIIDFQDWLDQELVKCDQGKKNPILMAAQVYERIVTLHLYENGNGRVGQLMLNYILERYGLPPAVASPDLKALFPLKEINKNPEAFLVQIMTGIEQSMKLL
ncbi:MAG: Fic family protein [Parachlamydia sp.]|nr:Fic family protein [Parachlamydia sp.]